MDRHGQDTYPSDAPRRWRDRLRSVALPSSFVIWVGTGLLSSIFLGFVLWSSFQSYHRTIAAAEASVQNIALVLEEYTKRSVGQFETVLQAALHEHRASSSAKAGSEPNILEAVLSNAPHVRNISVLDARTGAVLRRWRSAGTAGEAMEMDALQAHAQSELGLHIGVPRWAESTQTWMVGLSRREMIAPGTAVVIAAHVALADLQRFFEAIKVGGMGAIGLFRKDGILLARQPYDPNNVGRNLGHSPLFTQHLAGSAVGTFESVTRTDGVRRIVAYRRVGATPLVVTAALARSEVLTPWLEDVLKLLALVPLVTAALLVFGLLLSNEARRRDAAEAQAREKTAIFEATLDHMDEGLLMFDADNTVQVCNRRAMELLELPPDFMAKKPTFRALIEHQIRTGEFSRSDEGFQAWVKAGGFDQALALHTYERERPNGTVIEVRTVRLPTGGAVRTFTDITARRQAHQRILHMARHDVLTELPNRLLFRERIEAVLSNPEEMAGRAALLCLDLDFFKGVNDSYGHPAGDALLAAVGKRISGLLGPSDMPARFGGDEFAILQIGADQPGSAETLARRIVEELAKPFTSSEHRVTIGASVGIAIPFADGNDADQLLKRADLALYQAKADGRGTYRLFELEMDAAVQARRSLELDLREALRKGEFVLHYQPCVDVETRRVVAFEALLRWHHPTRGLVQPADFIPLAEETGLIVPIGEWVLREACIQAATWPSEIRVAVNVSAAQLSGEDLARVTLQALALAGLSPNRLELEITETVLMTNSEASLRALHRLRNLGVQIAMDDFGTGYSSLSYLRSFPFDRIKIDRSFVKEIGNSPGCAQIVISILSLGARLGISITAEGVETEEQLAFLRAEGCDEAQGFLFSVARPAADLFGGQATAAA